MIEQLTGKITYKSANYAILNVSGIGYKVFTTPDVLAKVGVAEQTLWTHLAVRENSLDLYGFLAQSDLKFFELLLSISGIGPKSALGVLATADTETLKNAISTADTGYLTKVSGIGKKSADRIIIELKDKVGKVQSSNFLKEDADALDVLVSMGYQTSDVREVLKSLPCTLKGTSKRVKESLSLLSKNI